MVALNRAKIIDDNFQKIVNQSMFPLPKTMVSVGDAKLNQNDVLQLFDAQLISRHLDLQARVLKEKQQAFYTIASSGHEGNCAVAKAFLHTDPAFLHYRSGAFFIQRALAANEENVIEDILLSLVAASDDPIAAGRHKVFGSVSLSIPPQTSTIASHLPKAVGLATALSRSKNLAIKYRYPLDSVVLCSFGDASLNHATAQGALNTIQWIMHNHCPMPIVLICEDNGIGISVKTPEDWIYTTMSNRHHIEYIPVDGLNIADVYRGSCLAAKIARVQKKPVFLHMKTVRLMGHAGSDIESQYRSEAEIVTIEKDDPLLHSARVISEQGWMSTKDIIQRYEYWRNEIKIATAKVVNKPKLSSAKAIMSAIIPPHRKLPEKKSKSEAIRQKIYGEYYPQLKMKRNLCQQLNFALLDAMIDNEDIFLFGEDIAKKGGVYRVTAGLYQRFGGKRVFDTLLDEQTILGTAIGFAQQGLLPIPEIQFLAYLHNAEDQLRGEAATLSFFSSGQYTNPMVIRIAGLSYQKGFGGHFHNDNSIAILRDIPGIIIACPANGEDAAKMLRTCIFTAKYQQRIVVFLEPIALYMMKDLHQPGDEQWLSYYPCVKEAIAVGEIGVYGDGQDILMISYANGYYLSRQAQQILQQQYQIDSTVIDLRWLAPLNEAALLKMGKSFSHILIIDEGRKTGSISEALITLYIENFEKIPHIKRLTGADSFITIGTSWQYLLPCRDDIVKMAVNMLST